MRVQPSLVANACRIGFVAAVTVGVVLSAIHFYVFLILLFHAARSFFVRGDDGFRGWGMSFAIGAAISAALTSMSLGR